MLSWLEGPAALSWRFGRNTMRALPDNVDARATNIIRSSMDIPRRALISCDADS
jgi:hypothetical protein